MKLAIPRTCLQEGCSSGGFEDTVEIAIHLQRVHGLSSFEISKELAPLYLFLLGK